VSLRKWIKEFREDWAAAGEALDRNERARARRRAAAPQAPQDDAAAAAGGLAAAAGAAAAQAAACPSDAGCPGA
jgi:hypothetical protein